MRVLSIIAMATLTVAAPATAEEQAAQRVRAAVEQAMTARGFGPLSGPGCAFSVGHADRLVFASGYGAANIEDGAPFEPRTVSESGSVAKQFMAAAILTLAEQGRLSLADDIREHLPEMPDYGEPIRISDLVYQTSGVREWSTLAALRGYPRAWRKIYTLNDLVALVASQRTLNFPPGTRYEYSNSNYGLLTAILERVSGVSANEFSKRHLFAPLGMDSTQWRDDHRRIVPHRAVAYRRTASGFEHAMPMEDVYGHGALLTTVEDLQRWNKALMSGGLSDFVTRHLLAQGRLRNGEARDYGGGIRLGAYRGRTVYRHAGVTAGYTAQLWAFPAERVSIAFLCNASPGDTNEIAAHIADAALGLDDLPRAPASRAAEGPAQIAGNALAYFLSKGGEIVAVATKGQQTFVNLFTRAGLVEVVPGDSPGVLTATSPNYGTLTVRFADADSLVVSLEGREPTVFSRMPRAAAAIPIEGHYASADLRAAYTVTRRAGEYRMELADRHADDPLVFRLEWLNGERYLARIETKSGYLRDDFVVSFTRTALIFSSVAGLQGVDLVEFRRTARAAATE